MSIRVEEVNSYKPILNCNNRIESLLYCSHYKEQFFKNRINQEINNSGSRLRSARSTCIVAAILTVQQFLSPQKISLEKRAAEHNNRNSSEKWFKYMVTALLNYERYRTIKPEKNVANKNCSSNAFD